MYQLLPKDVPTLRHWTSGNWTRPDNVFGSCNLEEMLISCAAVPHLRGPGTDHVPIQTVFDLTLLRKVPPPSYNFCMTDWKKFREHLTIALQTIPTPSLITNKEQLAQAALDLTTTVQNVMKEVVPMNKPCPHSRRWWTKSLSDLRTETNKLSNISYQFRTVADHPSHAEH
ncbi:hypothetical protein JAAARDRAFT_138253, partial [Jaapia argillacea MUCL 33604]